MKKKEYFEYRYDLSKQTAIQEMGELPEYYDEFQMKNMCEYFFDIGYGKALIDNEQEKEIQ
jgi:hypothetical protein